MVVGLCSEAQPQRVTTFRRRGSRLRNATFSTVLLSVHPLQLKPTIIVTAAPAAAPCKRRFRESPCRIDGTMTFTLRIGGTRAKQCADVQNADADRIRTRHLFLECYCASRWRHRRHCRERKLRYVVVFWAALEQTATCPQIYRVSSVKHKQEVEKLEYLLVDWAWSLGELSPQGARAIAYHLSPNSAVSACGPTRNSDPWSLRPGRWSKWRRAKHNHGFDRPAPVTEVSVNLKIGVQRVGLNLCKSGLGAAYWARVSWLEHERRILKTHVLSFRPTLVRCD